MAGEWSFVVEPRYHADIEMLEARQVGDLVVSSRGGQGMEKREG